MGRGRNRITDSQHPQHDPPNQRVFLLRLPTRFGACAGYAGYVALFFRKKVACRAVLKKPHTSLSKLIFSDQGVHTLHNLDFSSGVNGESSDTDRHHGASVGIGGGWRLGALPPTSFGRCAYYAGHVRQKFDLKVMCVVFLKRRDTSLFF